MTLTADDLASVADAVADRLGAEQPARLLNATQAAELLSVPKTWLMSEARADRVPVVRLGKYVRFRRSDLEEWVDRRVR